MPLVRAEPPTDLRMPTLASPGGVPRLLHGPLRFAYTSSTLAWAVLIAMLCGQLWLVTKYTRGYPFADEVYEMSATITPGWLWAQHAEHRLPLAKLIWLGVLRLTAYDFRIGNWLSVIGVASVAGALIWTATRARGYASLSDAFFPLAVLSFGQALNFLWWWQVNHILAPLVATSLLILLVLKGSNLTFPYASIAACGVLLLSLSGPGGLPYAVGLGAWVGQAGLRQWRSADHGGRIKSVLLLASAATALGLVGLYFVGYRLEVGMAGGIAVSEVSMQDALATGIQILSISLGPASEPYWQLAGSAVLILLIACMARLVVVWFRQPQEHVRAGGLLFFGGAMCSLFAVLARARTGLGQDYIFVGGHYLTLAVPVLSFIYLVSILYLRRGTARIVQFGLLAALFAFLLPNVKFAIETGIALRSGQSAFTNDLQSGMPPLLLAERDQVFLNPAASSADDTSLDDALKALQSAGVRQFAQMASDPVYRTLSLPAPTSGGQLRNATALELPLGGSRFVYAIRIHGTFDAATREQQATFKIFWNPVDPENTATRLPQAADMIQVDANTAQDMWAARFDRADQVTLDVWVNQTVSGFGITPQGDPAGFTVSAIDVLVPTAP